MSPLTRQGHDRRTKERRGVCGDLKDQLKTIFWYVNRDDAKRTPDTWCAMADRIDHPSVGKFAGRLRFFEYGILNHCDYAIDTGKLEGVKQNQTDQTQSIK